MRLHCSNCGKAVSNTVPDNTVVRAWIECVECIEKKPESAQQGVHLTGQTCPCYREPRPKTTASGLCLCCALPRK